jgi:hypothetical protein
VLPGNHARNPSERMASPRHVPQALLLFVRAAPLHSITSRADQTRRAMQFYYADEAIRPRQSLAPEGFLSWREPSSQRR